MPDFLTSRRRRLFILLILLSLGQVALAVWAAGAMDEIFAGHARPAAAPVMPALDATVRIVIVLAGIGLAEFCRRWLTEALGLDYTQEVRLTLFERHLRKPVQGGKTRSRGNVLLPFVGDLTALRSWWADGVARGCSAIAVAAGICIFLLATRPVLGAAMVCVLLGASGIFALLASPYANATRRQRRSRGALTGLISDRIAAAHSVFGLGGLQRELQLVQKKMTRLNQDSLQRAQWSGAIRATTAIAPVLASFLALVSLRIGPVAPGATHNVVGPLLLAGLLGNCIADLARAIELAIPGRIAMRRIETRLQEITPLRLGAATQSAARPAPAGALLELRNLRLANWSSPFSTTCAAGDIVLVDGPVGSGKSTLLAILGGMQPAPRGRVRVLGQPASRLPQRTRREHLGFAADNLPLLQASLAGNIRYRLREPIDDDALAQLIQACALSRYLAADGSIIGKTVRDGGANLPQADVAAIKVVRAMAGRPDILILDDVLDRLAPGAEAAMPQLFAGWPGTILLTSAQPRWRSLANRHWSLSGDGIEERHAPLPADKQQSPGEL